MTSARNAMKTIAAPEGLISKLRRATAYIVILVAAIYLYIVSEHFRFEHVPGRIGPDAWPKIIIILLMATCVWQVVRIVAFGATEASEDEMDEEAIVIPTEPGNFVALAWYGVAITAVYAFLMPKLGFFLSTVLYLAAIATVAGRFRRPVPLLLTSIFAPLVLMFVFMRIVYIALPLGTEPFKGLSLLLLKLMGVH